MAESWCLNLVLLSLWLFLEDEEKEGEAEGEDLVGGGRREEHEGCKWGWEEEEMEGVFW